MKSNTSISDSRTSFVRLKHALESSEGREKYRANTKSPSDGDDVRWYFSKSPLSLEAVAASTPLSEVVGKSDFLRFSVNDSLSLEAAFLKEEEELVSAWWKEYAECSEGPLGVSAKGKQASSSKDVDSEHSSSGISETSKCIIDAELYESDEVIGVSVKGGLYEVDLFRRRCFPVYWTGDHRRVLRGHWFAQKGGLDWLPLREDVSEQLEFAYRSQIWHRRTFQPSGKFAAKVNLQSPIEGLHALFTGEDDTWEAWLGVDVSGIGSVLGFRGNGFQLRRGFAPSQSPQPTQDELHQRKEEEMDDYCSQVPVRHLVFMVHGIGQRLEKANLIDDVGTFRHTTTLLAQQHLTPHQRNSLRVLFIPCQWRRGLKLGGEEAVENCTLEGVRALRTMLSATVHDVLYYMSPVYCQDIIDSVSRQLNMLYCKFIKRNPGYEGKVSIYGHSLGSVLSFDILCHQSKLTSSFPMSQLHENSQNLDAWNLEKLQNQENGDLNEPEQIEEPLTKNHTATEYVSVQDSPEHETKNHTATEYASVQDSHEHETSDTELDKLRNEVFLSNDVSVQDSHEHEISDTELDKLRNEIAKLKEKIASLEKTHNATKQVGGIDEYLLASHGQAVQDQNIEGPPHGSTAGKDESDEKEKDSANQENASGPTGLTPSPQASNRKGYLKPRSSSRKRYTPYIEYTKLAFEVDTFFAVGSPLGVFLSQRNIRLGIGNGKEYWKDDGIEEEMPACKRLFNVFHPFDPVAYRIEPLVCKEYIPYQPVFVPYHRGGRRLHIGMQEFGKEMSARSTSFVHSVAAARDWVTKVFTSAPEKVEEAELEPKERTYGSYMIEKLTGEPDGRIDFMLQDATFEHQYLQAISSHTAYWQDADTALFILKHLYWDIPQESPDHKPETAAIVDSNDASQPTQELSTVLSENNVADEELSFTFSQSDSITSTRSNSSKRTSQEQL